MTADNRSANIGVDVGWKMYPWLSTQDFIYIGGRFMYQRSEQLITPEAAAGFHSGLENNWAFGWVTSSLVLSYGHTVDWSDRWATAFSAGASLGRQKGYAYQPGYTQIREQQGAEPLYTAAGTASGDRFLKTGSVMPAIELGVELFPMGQNRRWSVSFRYVQNLVENTASQASSVYENMNTGTHREYGYNSRIRYANIMIGLHAYLWKLKGGVRVNRSNRDDCTSI